MPPDQPPLPTPDPDVRLTAIGLNKWVRKDLNLLQDISLCIQPNEFVIVVGQSGGGKSTLLDALSGYRPATHGQVFANDADVYKNYDAIRALTGYVPQRDIIHMELTVYEALDYAARLRLPRHTRKAERRQRILEVLDELDLAHRKDVVVSRLSGGQQKRVSIGVELLTRPPLFFLDEPTSGLDPGTETSLMHLLRRLADQGRTVVLVTHTTKNVKLADQVVFLARGGYLAWFGPPEEALRYFDAFRTEAEQQAGPMEFDEIYALLEDPTKGSAQEWSERYRSSPAYQQHVEAGLRQNEGAGKAPSLRQRLVQARDSYLQQISPFTQFLVLSARNLRILARDRISLILMLLAPLLVGGLDWLIASVMGADVYDFQHGSPMAAVQSLSLLTLYTLMVASLSQMREFTKETAIYKRERMVNLRLLPYIGSKVWFAALLSLFHAAAYTQVRYLAFDMPGGQTEFWMIFVTLYLGVLAGMALGLLASALAPNTSAAPMITILLLIPTTVLSGALVQLPPRLSAVSSSHWVFRGLVAITGVGADVAADDCWQFPLELRQAMTVDDKLALGCRCMGVNMFAPGSCNYPGLGGFYTSQIDQPPPERPPDLGEAPAPPTFPPPPAEPEDAYDKVAVAAYLNALQAYQADVARLQAGFQEQVDAYKLTSAVYQAEMSAYQEQLSKWYVGRSAAVGAGEATIAALQERFGWAFVRKDDPQVFQAAIFEIWQAQGVIIAIQLALAVLLVKRRDASN
ncbi:MAG: ATP-binding cassette domain-containing protein [Chloroflexota bacterium]